MKAVGVRHTPNVATLGIKEKVEGMARLIFYMLAFHRQRKGQSMAEFCVAVPVLVLLLWSILDVSDMFIIKHETMVSARYGAWLSARYDLTADQFRAPISEHFFKDRIHPISLESHTVEQDQNQGGFIDKTRSRLESERWTDSIFEELTDNLFTPHAPNMHSLTIAYEFPRVFGALDLRENGENFFNIQSEHFVMSSTHWDGQRVDLHHVKQGLEEALRDVLIEMDQGVR